MPGCDLSMKLRMPAVIRVANSVMKAIVLPLCAIVKTVMLPGASRTTSVHAAVACVVTINKLPAFSLSVTTLTMAAIFSERSCGHSHR